MLEHQARDLEVQGSNPNQGSNNLSITDSDVGHILDSVDFMCLPSKLDLHPH